MKHDVKVPSPGESITEVYIGTWFRKSGDIVKKGDVLVDIETQKASVELEAEASGRLEVLVPTTGAKAAVGDVIATIDDSVAADTVPAGPAKSPLSHTAPAQAPVVAHAGVREVPLSPAVRKIVDEKNIDVAQIPGTGRGGRILKEDVLAAEKVQPTGVSASPAAPVTAVS